MVLRGRGALRAEDLALPEPRRSGLGRHPVAGSPASGARPAETRRRLALELAAADAGVSTGRARPGRGRRARAGAAGARRAGGRGRAPPDGRRPRRAVRPAMTTVRIDAPARPSDRRRPCAGEARRVDAGRIGRRGSGGHAMTTTDAGLSGRRALASRWLAAILWLGLPVAGEAAGPWRAQVVDAETGQPLEGVAVIGVWHRRLMGHGLVPLWPTGWVGADETATDAAGRFTLPAPVLRARRIVTHVPEPELGLFKAGYGGWRFRDREAPLTRPGAVIEMRPLRSPDERRKYLEGRWTREERARLRAGWRARRGAPELDRPPVPGGAGVRGRDQPGAGRPRPPADRDRLSPPLDEVPPARPAGGGPGGGAAPRRAGGRDRRRRPPLRRRHRAPPDRGARRGRARWCGPGAGSAGSRARSSTRAASPWTGRGRVYVADWGNHRIQRFTREGRLLGQFGGLRFEDFDGLFNPTGVAAPDTGEIVVHDRHVYMFTPEGRRLGARRLPFRTATRCGIAVDAAGHLYVVGDQDRRVHKLDAGGPRARELRARPRGGRRPALRPDRPRGRRGRPRLRRRLAPRPGPRPRLRARRPPPRHLVGRATTASGSGCRRGSRWTPRGGSTWRTATCRGS